MEANHLFALTSLITSSVEDIVSAYASAGQSVPVLDSVEQGQFDTLAIDDIPDKLIHAIQLAEAACLQLICSVSRPGTVFLSKARMHLEMACLGAVLNARIPDLLVNKPEGMHVTQLAELSQFTAGVNKLERVMRLLAIGHGIYAHNRLSIKLISKEGIPDVLACSRDHSSASIQLSQALTMPGGYGETAFKQATGHKLFEYYGLPENKDKEEQFQRSLAGWEEDFSMGYLRKVYPWSTKPPSTVVCDIGAGNGRVTLDLIKRHPHLKLVIQDQSAVVQVAKEFRASNYPEVPEGRVDFVPIDFFKDAPVEGCDVYFIKSVLHDWTDAECVSILKNIRKAMKPSSRLIIQEVVIRKVLCSDNPQVDETEMPTWGPSEVKMFEYDILMMELFDGKERTLEELVQLGTQSRLEFKEMYPAGDMALVEFSPM